MSTETIFTLIDIFILVTAKFAVYPPVTKFSVLHAGERLLFIQISWNELDVYARPRDRVGHALQLERLGSRSGMGESLQIHAGGDDKL